MKKLSILFFALALAACAGGEHSSSNRGIAAKPVPSDPKDSGPNTTLLESVVAQGVPRAVASLAFSKYDSFVGKIKRADNMGVIDFRVHSGTPRFYLIDILSGKVDFLLVAHGSGSDPGATGIPTKFSNVPDSHMSSLGSYLVSEKYQFPGHGTAARLDGLEKTNNLARQRGIVLHSAQYVSTSLAKVGMSWGCPAVSLEWIADTLKRLSGGGFLYAYGPPQPKSFDEELEIQRMISDPLHTWTDESASAPAAGEW